MIMIDDYDYVNDDNNDNYDNDGYDDSNDDNDDDNDDDNGDGDDTDDEDNDGDNDNDRSDGGNDDDYDNGDDIDNHDDDYSDDDYVDSNLRQIALDLENQRWTISWTKNSLQRKIFLPLMTIVKFLRQDRPSVSGVFLSGKNSLATIINCFFFFHFKYPKS